MTDQIFIYVLTEPGTGEVRYVGKTYNVQKRYYGHLCDMSNTHKTHWIQSLLAKGVKPDCKVIEILTATDDWEFKERFWIKLFRDKGFKLTNNTDGGDGAFGYKHTEEAKQKFSLIHKGHVKSELTCRKLSESNSTRKLTNKDVIAIRERCEAGELRRDIAYIYGVNESSITKIVRGLSYKHIGGPIQPKFVGNADMANRERINKILNKI